MTNMTETVNVMEAIWESSEKVEDGCLYYPIEFIDFLWDNGFIDTETYPRKTWHQAFEPFKQPDGIYRLSREEFLSLDKYRYKGPIRIPFDAMRINEGKYTDEGFDQLARESIQLSCSLESLEFRKQIDAIKTEFREPDDLILIKAPAKQKIKKLIDDHPSPLHKLELFFDTLLKQRGIKEEVEETKQKVSRVATAEQAAATQISTFVTGATSLAEVQSMRLKEITKAKALNESPADTGGEPLKKIKRSKKGLRG